MDYTALRELIEIDSPTGYTTQRIGRYIYDLLKGYGWQPELTNKGAVKCALGDAPRLGLAAHVDTLGLMVSGIKYDGTLAITPLGAPSLTSAEGEYVRVHYAGRSDLHRHAAPEQPELARQQPARDPAAHHRHHARPPR